MCNNLILHVNNQAVFFYHESYLDYFCAKALQKTFHEQEQISTDFFERRWYTALILCSDLTYPEEKTRDYIRFLFRGGICRKPQKPLASFTAGDFNEHLLIACKAGYNVRFVHPRIYSEAEQYLNNTLILWLNFVLSGRTEPLPAEILFSAVAALNSEKLIRKVLTDDRWVSLWLYDLKYEKNMVENEQRDNLPALDFECIIREYSRNTPDFSLTYRLINERLQADETWLLTSVHRNLTIFRNYLLSREPVRFLISYFKQKEDWDVLRHIMIMDFHFVEDNFQTILKSKCVAGQPLFITIIRSHPFRDQCYELVFSHLHLLEDNEEEVSEIIEFSVFHNEATGHLMNYLDKLLIRNPQLFRKMLVHVRRIAWDKLSVNIRNSFLSNLPAIVKVRYNFDHIDKQYQKIFISVDGSCDNLITRRFNNTVRFENGMEGSIKNIIRNKNAETRRVLTFSAYYGVKMNQISASGTLRYYVKSRENTVYFSFAEKVKAGEGEVLYR